MTFHHLLRLSTSLFVGIICTSSFSLFLLLSIVNNSNISVNSLHHDFQTVYIITADRWSRNPQLRAAVELRWLWASLGFALTIGLLPKERVDRLLGWFAATNLYVRARSAVFASSKYITSLTAVMTERGTDQLRMLSATGLFPCTSPELQTHPTEKHLPSRPSRSSQLSRPPLSLGFPLCYIRNQRHCHTSPNQRLDLNFLNHAKVSNLPNLPNLASSLSRASSRNRVNRSQTQQHP